MTWRGWFGFAVTFVSAMLVVRAETTDLGLIGPWGGEHIRMSITSRGADIEYDCALGTIDEPIRPSKEGKFEVRGTHTPRPSSERGAPSTEPQEVVFEGWTDRQQMHLTVKLSRSGRLVGEYTLHYGEAAKLAPCLQGTWGGEHIRLSVSEGGATVEYDCAVGTIDEPLRPDADGNFTAKGTHSFEQGGPQVVGQPQPRPRPALYEGWTDGSQMRLTVTLPRTSRNVGTFSLGHGREAKLEKCL